MKPLLFCNFYFRQNVCWELQQTFRRICRLSHHKCYNSSYPWAEASPSKTQGERGWESWCILPNVLVPEILPRDILRRWVTLDPVIPYSKERRIRNLFFLNTLGWVERYYWILIVHSTIYRSQCHLTNFIVNGQVFRNRFRNSNDNVHEFDKKFSIWTRPNSVELA